MGSLGKQLRLKGMTLAAAKRNADLEEGRAFLVRLAMCHPDREVSADDLILREHPLHLGNAAGSLFRGKEWEWTGKFRESIVPSRHCGILKIWRLK